MGTYFNAAKGLKLAFWSKIIYLIITAVGIISTIISTVAAFSSFASGNSGLAASGIAILSIAIIVLGGLVCGILAMVGYGTAGRDHAAFMSACICSIIAVLADLFGSLIKNNMAATGAKTFLVLIFNLTSYIVGYLVVSYVCEGVNSLSRNLNDSVLSAEARSLKSFYSKCVIIIIICMFLAYVPIISIIAAVTSLGASIALIVANIKFLILLSHAYTTFEVKKVPSSEPENLNGHTTAPVQSTYTDPFMNMSGPSSPVQEEKKPFIPYGTEENSTSDGASTTSSSAFKLKD